MNANASITICPAALAVDGLPGGLTDVPAGHLIHLAYDTLGIPAGLYLTGRAPVLGDHGRTLYRLADTDEDAAEYRNQAGATVYRGSAAPTWPHPFAVPVRGITLGQLRASDLPDDAFIVLYQPDEYNEGPSFVPAIEPDLGVYVPGLSGHTQHAGEFWNPQWSDEEHPTFSVPAVALKGAT